MSADNWRQCPKCAKIHDEHLDELYGKVPENVYNQQVLESDTIVGENLAEYKEVGITDAGTFYVSYQAVCRICGFDWSYKHEEQVPLK